MECAKKRSCMGHWAEEVVDNTQQVANFQRLIYDQLIGPFISALSSCHLHSIRIGLPVNNLCAESRDLTFTRVSHNSHGPDGRQQIYNQVMRWYSCGHSHSNRDDLARLSCQAQTLVQQMPVVRVRANGLIVLLLRISNIWPHIFRVRVSWMNGNHVMEIQRPVGRWVAGGYRATNTEVVRIWTKAAMWQRLVNWI